MPTRTSTTSARSSAPVRTRHASALRSHALSADAGAVGERLALALDPVRVAQAAGYEPDPWQARLLRSSAAEIIMLASRQSGKSTVAAILAVHEAVFRAPALVLLIAPTLKQSQELYRKIRAALASLGDVAPALLKETELTFETVTGSRVACVPAQDGGIRGFSAVSLLIIDEAAWVRDDVYTAARPFLIVSRGRLIALSTPHGRRGWFFHEFTEGGPTWERVCITAEHCPRITPKILAAERDRIGEYAFRQEYGCEFVDTEDQFFASELIERAIDEDVQPFFPGGRLP